MMRGRGQLRRMLLLLLLLLLSLLPIQAQCHTEHCVAAAFHRAAPAHHVYKGSTVSNENMKGGTWASSSSMDNTSASCCWSSCRLRCGQSLGP
jgi:hypothetical protein